MQAALIWRTARLPYHLAGAHWQPGRHRLPGGASAPEGDALELIPHPAAGVELAGVEVR